VYYIVVVYNSTLLLLFHCRRRCVVSVHSRLSGVGAKTHVLPGPPRPAPTATHRSPAGRRMRPIRRSKGESFFVARRGIEEFGTAGKALANTPFGIQRFVCRVCVVCVCRVCVCAVRRYNSILCPINVCL